MMRTRKAKPADEWMSLPAAERALGESRLTVLNRIVKGDLVGQHIAGRTVVRRDTVERLAAARQDGSPAAA